MNILITGAGGFIGQALASALMVDSSVSTITLTDVFEPPVPQNSSSSCTVGSVKADLTSPENCRELFTADLTHVYLLHWIMSGAAEANLELGLKVNVDSVRLVVDMLRKARPGIRVIFPSSLAVFGPMKDGAVVTETTMPLPQSSYGAQKHISEVLLDDYSRRGLIDARIVRLPTIIVRPGAPSGAASSFCSGILREPLNGETSALPVSKTLKLWISSTRTVISNLLIARDVPFESFQGGSRIVNLPGITVTVQDMLEALEQVGGSQAASLVEEVYDEKISRIVSSWPASFDISHAQALGFQEDGPVVQAIEEYIEDYRR